jgi:hypothetical protein
MYRSLLASGVVERLDTPDEEGRTVRVTVDLQEDFALNRPLSPFVLDAIGHLDADSPDWPLDVLSIVEATLEDPGVVLGAQLHHLRGEVVEQLKRDGVEYVQRMEKLDELEHPKPLRDETYALFNAYAAQHPWVADHNIKPKSVARDMFERAMTFTDFIGHYGLARSEGLVLRYLTDAYKALIQNVPEDAKTEELLDLTAWLGETVRHVDSSLLDEWEELRHPTDPEHEEAPSHRMVVEPAGVSRNERAFRVMVRNETFRWVELLSRRGYGALVERDASGDSSLETIAAFMAPYWERHESIGIDGAARSADLVTINPGSADGSRVWRVRQVLDDPDGERDWAIHATVDLDESDEEGVAVVRLDSIGDAVPTPE